MTNTMKESMEELMNFAKNKSHSVSVQTYSLKNLPDYDPKHIQNLRKEKEMTQRRFADLLGVSVRTVEAWETGKSHPNGSAKRLMQLVEYDSTTVEDIERVSAIYNS